jgi:purine nucleosidase
MMSGDEVRKRFIAPLMRPVLDMAEIWFEGFYPSITFHDPLAAATIFERDLCTYQQGMVKVDQADLPGKTIWQPGQSNAPHQVAITVDVDRYFQHFFSVLGSE